ncbi:Putative teichuronic acid biosynthesis glycosyltransferase TuaC [Tsuneonella dongtanensis]|uniref:Putative teichuronic acid biosynthesis glycosyltransferase TuaC n=1 Tax=Tsuneonella dongtanensis TaxID=692370 RepID=A0A1B2AGB0_9SPHN|nr:glycosyltransferase [Tsuneonella dongtanensis]ANY21176.1 Putative teichuronic acid biosynthesis glycosyltransferase TuaC [Tsuneonella dongtanensis]
MRRVLSLATLYPNAVNPRFGTFVARSLEALAARGDWQVTVINPIALAPVALGRYAALTTAAVGGLERGVEVHRPVFRTIPSLGARFNPALIARKILPLVRRLHAENAFDIVDAQFFYPDGPAAARLARELDLPLSIKARGADIHYWGARSDTRSQIVEAGARAGVLLAVCGALADDMAALGLERDKITVHYTGLDRDRFRPLQHPQLRRRLGRELGIALPDAAPVLATVGALISRKGQSLVIDALAGLPGDCILLLVGRGDDEATLRRRAAERGVGDRVHFLGSLDHDLLPLVLSAADAMVLPSASEGLANAWVEALACGTPLVITDAGGAREVVTTPEAGRIVARDARAIAEGVRELLADPPSRDAVAAMADRFSWQANAAALAEHYERLAG